MKGKFLTKKTKITIREEKEPNGLKVASTARKESGTFNTDALKNFDKKMSNYYEFDKDEEFIEPKVNRSDYEEAYEIEALGAGKMSGLKYDNEDTEVFKSFMKRIDDLNDTSEYDKDFGTHDGFGEGEKEDDTYELLKTNSEKYKKHKYEIEALGAGKMSGLKYDNEDTEVFKSFMKRIDDLNDTSEYDKDFGTHDGFGEGEKEDDTYELLKTNSEKYKKHKYDKPEEYHDTPRVRVTNESKDSKMKRLNFKNEFKTEYEMLNLIPEHYKSDGHVFLMTDGNQTYKVRWDDSLKEGTVLSYKNKSMINEDTNKMKKLFNYKYSDSMGKTNNYSEETNTFKNLFESTKGKTLL